MAKVLLRYELQNDRVWSLDTDVKRRMFGTAVQSSFTMVEARTYQRPDPSVHVVQCANSLQDLYACLYVKRKYFCQLSDDIHQPQICSLIVSSLHDGEDLQG